MLSRSNGAVNGLRAAMTRNRTIEVLSDPRDRPLDDRQFVSALARGLRVLRVFSSAHETLSNRTLADRTGLSKPTISRLTYTLSRLGYLSHDRETGRYRLGPGALSLGYASLSNLDARQTARPLMQELAEYAGASVALCARDGLSMIYLEIRRSPVAVGLGLDIGDRVPLAVTSVGRAYLAALSDAARAPILEEIRRSDPAAWPKVRRGIENAIDSLHQRGFCTSFGDWLREIHSTGVPLETQTPYGTLALNIGGLASSLPVAKIEKDLGPRLVALARRVDELLKTAGFDSTWHPDVGPNGAPPAHHKVKKPAPSEV
jgi:DNA-binding IclR family transcriptional regulator